MVFLCIYMRFSLGVFVANFCWNLIWLWSSKMPTRCIVAGCSNTYKEGVSLHSFPKDANLRRIWTAKVKLTRAHWNSPSDSSVVCSDHFDASDFEEGLWAQFGLKKQKRLKPDAIPNIRAPSKDEADAKRKAEPRSAVEKRKKMRVSLLFITLVLCCVPDPCSPHCR